MRKYFSLFPTNKKAQGGNWKPIFLVLLITFIVALVLNLVLTAFAVDTSIPNPDSSISVNSGFVFLMNAINSDVFDMLPTGITILGIDISVPIFNLLALFGSGVQDFVSSQVNILTYVPVELLIPFIIMFILALVWSSVKLILP